jgi:hypothetical protein
MTDWEATAYALISVLDAPEGAVSVYVSRTSGGDVLCVQVDPNFFGRIQVPREFRGIPVRSQERPMAVAH